MTIVLDEPTLWPLISFGRLSSYFVAASSTAVIYDWALTFGQEFELILRQRWSFATVLYVFVRYFGILVSVMNLLLNLPVPITDVGCTILWYIQAWTPIIVNAVLGVIMVTRMNAMYQGSKKLLIFLVVVLLASTIVSGVMGVIANLGVSAQEAVISGYPTCFTEINMAMIDLTYESMISTAVWEILAFFLAVWIVIKHFYELRRRHSGATIEGYFTVLIESHAFYFLAFAIMACFTLGGLSPNITSSLSTGSAVYVGVFLIAQMLQTFVLGPRLVLSIREYNAKLGASTDCRTDMTSIAFQAGGNASTGGDV